MLKLSVFSALVLALLAGGCGSAHEGIRARATGPAIDEAFRKMTLAVTLDDYQIAGIDMNAHTLATSWRPIKDKERSDADRAHKGAIETRVAIRLDRRGLLYDASVIPELRYHDGEKELVRAADVRHPLYEKWQRTLFTVIDREAKEED